MKLIKLGLATILTSGALFAGTFTVDKSHSNVGFKVKHLMISNVVGKFDMFSGTIEYDEKTKTLQSISGKVEVKSINTANEKRDNHLKADDFFAAQKYPYITFESTKVENDEVIGKFTLRGVTKEVKFELENNGTIIDHRGNTKVGLSLYGKINRKDYGVSYNKVLEAGGVAVGDTIRLTIDLEGLLKK
ncbi:YceI family protein [Arcobacter sp. LA11]|uniref:YceI family protein n=1 Tax=Arcobacter sp. LA11 TaxID=1898176 RepID=UPI000933DC0F|nr:YceI family protein [Arcobacter sp. LA11]